MRSGAPSTASDATDPANMPISNPRSSAMRAEMASKTEAGLTQRPPSRTPRKRWRRSVQSIAFPFTHQWRHCEERDSATKQSTRSGVASDGLLRFARNDGRTLDAVSFPHLRLARQHGAVARQDMLGALD